MKPRIDWAKVWDKHNDWWNAELAKRDQCTMCGNIPINDPDWTEQTKAIERIVNAQLSKKVRKRK